MAEQEQKGCFIQTDFERPKPEKTVKVEALSEPVKQKQKKKKGNWFQRIFAKK